MTEAMMMVVSLQFPGIFPLPLPHKRNAWPSITFPTYDHFPSCPPAEGWNCPGNGRLAPLGIFILQQNLGQR